MEVLLLLLVLELVLVGMALLGWGRLTILQLLALLLLPPTKMGRGRGSGGAMWFPVNRGPIFLHPTTHPVSVHEDDKNGEHDENSNEGGCRPPNVKHFDF